MTAEENWNNGPELQQVKDALAKLFAEFTTADILVSRADSIFNPPELSNTASIPRDALTANLRTSTVVPLNRPEFSMAGMPRYDSDIHLKMQAELEVAFAHLKRF